MLIKKNECSVCKKKCNLINGYNQLIYISQSDPNLSRYHPDLIKMAL